MSRRSMIDEVASIDVTPVRTGVRSWQADFAAEHPEEYEVIVEAVTDWLQGGIMKAKFPTRSMLQKFLCGEHPTACCENPPLPHIADATFTKLVNSLRGKQHG